MGPSQHILTDGVPSTEADVLICIIKYDAVDNLSRKSIDDTILVGRINIDDHNLYIILICITY